MAELLNHRAWTCGACILPFNTAVKDPVLVTDHYGRVDDYCVECLQDELRPIAAGREDKGPPKIGPRVISEIPGVLARMDQGLVERYQRGLATIREFTPTTSLPCLNNISTDPREPELCNTRLGVRAEISADRRHQWIPCPKCLKYTCKACGSAQTPENLNAADCTRPLWLLQWDEAHNSPERGVTFNYCPRCDRPVELTDGCNEMDCVCDTKFCFICGRQQVGQAHWASGMDGCPRWLQPDNPRAEGDNSWRDAQNFGGYEFPPLHPQPSPWRQSAEQIRVSDRAVRQWRQVDISPDPDLQSRVTQLLLHGRHLFVMASGRANAPDFGLVYGHRNPHQMWERLRFVHHAAHFRYLMQRLYADGAQHLLPNDIDTEQGQIQWRRLFLQTRRLRYRNVAPHDDEAAESERHWDLNTLLRLIQDRLHGYRTTTENVYDSAAGARHTRVLRITESILVRCKRIVRILLLHPSATHFSASFSWYLHAALIELKDALDHVTRVGEDDFRNAGQDQAFALDIGCFFYYRLFEEDPEELRQTLPEDAIYGTAFDKIWTGELILVVEEILVMELPYDEEGEIGYEVYDLQSDGGLLQRTLGIFTGAEPRELSLELLSEVEHRYDELVRDVGTDVRPGVPDTVMQPVFFEVLSQLERMLVSYQLAPRRAIADDRGLNLAAERRMVSRWYRILRREHGDNQAENHPLRMLGVMKCLLTETLALGGVEELGLERLVGTFQEFDRLHTSCVGDYEEDPRKLWFEPAQRQLDILDIARRLTDTVLNLEGVEEALQPPPRSPPPPPDWHFGHVYVTGIIQQAHDAGYGVGNWYYDTLQLLANSLAKIRLDDWNAEDDRRHFEWRLTLRHLRLDLVVRGGAVWPPIADGGVRDRLDTIIADVLDFLEEWYGPLPGHTDSEGSQEGGDYSDED